MQLCVNSVQDRVFNNGLKFATRKTVRVQLCNQRKQYAEPSIMLDKSPPKVVPEAIFLDDVVYERTLS